MHEISFYKKLIIFVLINKKAFSQATAFISKQRGLCSDLTDEMNEIKNFYKSGFNPISFDKALHELITKDKVINAILKLELDESLQREIITKYEINDALKSVLNNYLVNYFWINTNIESLKRMYDYDEYERTNRFD